MLDCETKLKAREAEYLAGEHTCLESAEQQELCLIFWPRALTIRSRAFHGQCLAT